MTTNPEPDGVPDRIPVRAGSAIIGYVSPEDVDGVTRWHSWRTLDDEVGLGAHQDQAQAERYLHALASWAASTERSRAKRGNQRRIWKRRG